MASSLAPAPAPGYPMPGNQAQHPQSTAVAVTAASNGAGNPYVLFTPASAAPSTCQSLRKALGRYGKLLEDGTRKAADTTGNIWHHLRTAPNMADAAVARLAQGTKVCAEGGHERVFHQVFAAVPGEQLRKAYACYLSTSSGPVIGTLYLSTARLAFCSDSPLAYGLPRPRRPGARAHVLQGGASPEPSEDREPVYQRVEAGGEVHPDRHHGQPRVLVHGLRLLRQGAQEPVRGPSPSYLTRCSTAAKLQLYRHIR